MKGLECVEMLISYLYKLNYNQNTEAGVESHVKMCILADKYEILPLGTIAIDYFKEATTAASMSNSGCAGFCEAIRCAYGAAAVTQEIREHLVELIVECDAMGHAEFEGSALQAVMREYPDVAINVALASREPKRAITQPRYVCGHCAWWSNEISTHYCRVLRCHI